MTEIESREFAKQYTHRCKKCGERVKETWIRCPDCGRSFRFRIGPFALGEFALWAAIILFVTLDEGVILSLCGIFLAYVLALGLERVLEVNLGKRGMEPIPEGDKTD